MGEVALFAQAEPHGTEEQAMAQTATYQSGLDGVTREIKAQLAEIERIKRMLDPATRAMIKEADRSAAQCAAAVKQAKIAG